MFFCGLQKMFPYHTTKETDVEFLVMRSNLAETSNNSVLFVFPKEEIRSILMKVNEQRIEKFSLLSNTTYEQAIKIHDSFISRYSNETFPISDHGYNFEVSKASYEYLCALLCEISTGKLQNTVFWFSLRHRPIKCFDSSSYKEFFDNLCIFTVKVRSPIHATHTELKKMANSYLFNIAYNSNTIMSIWDISEEYKPIRRRIQRNGQLFPYKSYKNELIKYYYQAATAGMPLTQYLAYYHVAEFFFKSIAENEAFDNIEKLITHPSFSPYNKECIRNFYKKIEKIMKTQKEEGVWDEKIGFLLCLKKFVPDLNELKDCINDIDANALEYYRDNNIPFASPENEISNQVKDSVRINFNDSSDAIYANIRNRVYLVRNAIVHSKNGEKLRYEPFKHDKELQKEIPLIRAIAEEIIINSAKKIDLKL